MFAGQAVGWIDPDFIQFEIYVPDSSGESQTLQFVCSIAQRCAAVALGYLVLYVAAILLAALILITCVSIKRNRQAKHLRP